MKRFAFVATVIAMLAITTAAFAAEGIHYGVKVGGTYNKLWGDDAEGALAPDWGLGFSGGVFMWYELHEMFAVQPEVLIAYRMMTTEAVELAPDVTADIDWKFMDIQIPVLAKFLIPMEGEFHPNLFAGPYLGFNMTAEAEVGDADAEDIEDYKSLDYGAVIGGGWEYAMGEAGMLTMDIRYVMGLSSLDDSDDELDFKNQSIQVFFGWAW